MTPGLLGDLTVLELGEHVAGPYCGRLLAGLRAEVIKVEPPAGEPGRNVGPFKGDDPHPETGARFLHLNAGKKSVTLDLAGRTGQALFRRLLGEADILIENLGPGRLAAFGLDYPALAALKPDLITVAISWFGQTGPYRD